MKSSTRKILFATAIISCAGLVACGAPEEEDVFVEAIPGESMLALELDEEDMEGDEGEVPGAENPGDTDRPGLTPGAIRQHARHVAGSVNEMLAATHERIREITDHHEPTETEDGRCRLWEVSKDRNDWALKVCRDTEEARRFAVRLKGKPAGADDTAYVLVFAADARGHRTDEGRRGHGRAGYDLDNLHALTGRGPTGKIGIGYRVKGEARALRIGFRNFRPVDAEQAIDAKYSFRRAPGVGGQFRFGVRADFLTRDENEELERGQDGVEEKGRVAMTFARGKGARIAAAACGGTVGEGECVGVRHCYTRAGEDTYEAIEEDALEVPRFERTSCPALDMGDERVPEDELAPPGEDDLGMPNPEVPEAL